jgi:hypothetical protein
VLWINISLLVTGTTATLAAFGGETWQKGDSPILTRITRRGWVSLGLLVLAFCLGVTKEVRAKRLRTNRLTLCSLGTVAVWRRWLGTNPT